MRVDGRLSNSNKVRSGVPQGSVLGPLLFLIMIRDIDPETLEAMVGIFADDTRLWRAITGIEDSRSLQEDLNKVYSWADFNNATFNSEKFEAIRFKKGKTKEQPDPIYEAYNQDPIDFQAHIKDLRI